MTIASSIKANPTDPIGALIGAVITVLGILQIPEALGLTADQVATLGGALFTVAASIRAIAKGRHANK